MPSTDMIYIDDCVSMTINNQPSPYTCSECYNAVTLTGDTTIFKYCKYRFAYWRDPETNETDCCQFLDE